jgi:hypothetical protein
MGEWHHPNIRLADVHRAPANTRNSTYSARQRDGSLLWRRTKNSPPQRGGSVGDPSTTARLPKSAQARPSIVAWRKRREPRRSGTTCKKLPSGLKASPTGGSAAGTVQADPACTAGECRSRNLGPVAEQANQPRRRTSPSASSCAKAHNPRLAVPIKEKSWMPAFARHDGGTVSHRDRSD